MPSRHLILCPPRLLLPSIFPSVRVFPNESVLCIRWPKYWSFSFSISPSNEYSGLIFRIDWLDLLAVQGTFKSPPTPQFKSISSLALSLLYGPTLTSIHDYWKNHSFFSFLVINSKKILLRKATLARMLSFQAWHMRSSCDPIGMAMGFLANQILHWVEYQSSPPHTNAMFKGLI